MEYSEGVGGQLNVLSLFDGMSCGRLALDRAGVSINKYYSSEIDKWAIEVSTDNYPDIIQLGDITNWRQWDLDWGSIDLVIGGSPCQGFSMAGKQLAFDDPRSKLFFIFSDILSHIKSLNPAIKFLLENVRLNSEVGKEISNILGVQPAHINSNLVSAQNRPRLYWTNIPHTVPQDKGVTLKDIIEKEVDSKYYIESGKLDWLDSLGTRSTGDGSRLHLYNLRDPNIDKDSYYILQWPRGYNKGGFRGKDGKVPSLTTSSWAHNNLLYEKGFIRKLTPIECERLQTVPDGYTVCVSDTQRYKMLGNGWTVDVVSHIFKGLVG